MLIYCLIHRLSQTAPSTPRRFLFLSIIRFDVPLQACKTLDFILFYVRVVWEAKAGKLQFRIGSDSCVLYDRDSLLVLLFSEFIGPGRIQPSGMQL